MTKVSLDDLRKGSTAAALPERSYALCIRRDLLAEMDRLDRDLATQRIAAADEDKKPPARKGQGEDPAAVAIRTRIAELDTQIDENTGDLTLRAIQDGEWRRFADDHPARDGNERDQSITYGFCNTDDLIANLNLWAARWNDDQLGDGDWDTLLAPTASGGDLKALANLVVQMQEAADDPKWLLHVLQGGQTSSVEETSPEQ